MEKFKAVAACDVASFCRKIEYKLVDIQKLAPPEQRDAIEELLDFIQDMEFDLDSEIIED